MHRLLRSLRSSALGAFALAGSSLHPAIVEASSPYLVVPDAATVETTAAYRYANMTNDEAIAELDRRGLPYMTVDPVPGVRAPIRLTGRLHGVLIHTAMAPNQRATSPFEILDARLALALDDFTAILEKHDIDEIEHFSMYRPHVPRHVETPKRETAKPPAQAPRQTASNAASTPTRRPTTSPKKEPAAKKTKPASSPPASDKSVPRRAEKPSGKAAPKALGKAGLGPKTSTNAALQRTKQKTPGDIEEASSADKNVEIVTEPMPKEEAPKTQANPAPPPMETRHPGGLAIDVGKMRKKDGTWISVLTHFRGKIGDKACGIDAPVPAIAEARELRALVCEAMGNHLFTYVLTPNYNAAHADHFHMEIKPGVKWFLVH